MNTSLPIQYVQRFNYEVVRTGDLSLLEEFKDHRRLQCFYHKGTQCVSCERVGTQLVWAKDLQGNIHVDVCTDDLYPMTVDHMLARSKGGKDHISNMQPMCSGCNLEKSFVENPKHRPNPNSKRSQRRAKEKAKRQRQRDYRAAVFLAPLRWALGL